MGMGEVFSIFITMQAVRQIVDSEKLCQIVDMPEDMRYSQVEIIVLPVVVSSWKDNSVSDELFGILEGTEVSSYKFMENKKHEKELEEAKFTRNKA